MFDKQPSFSSEYSNMTGCVITVLMSCQQETIIHCENSDCTMKRAIHIHLRQCHHKPSKFFKLSHKVSLRQVHQIWMISISSVPEVYVMCFFSWSFLFAHSIWQYSRTSLQKTNRGSGLSVIMELHFITNASYKGKTQQDEHKWKYDSLVRYEYVVFIK